MILSATDAYSPADGQLEIAALETDIMRFMAIIGFCLMVIFALVQSMPVSTSEQAIKEASAEQNRQLIQTKNQQVQLSSLMIENEQLKQSLSTATEALEQLSQAFSAEMKKLTDIENQLTQKAQSLTSMQAANEKAAKSLQQQAAAMALLKAKQASVKPQTLAKEPTKSAPETRADAKTKTETKTETPVKQPAPDQSKKGFTLQFSSDALFRKLVLANQVQLFVKTDKGYQVYRQGALVPTALNHQLYAMDEATVPAAFVKLLPANTGRAVSWSVALPKSTVREVNRLMSAYQYGALVIGKNASVARLP